MSGKAPSLEIRPYAPGDEAAIVDTFNLVFRQVIGDAYVDRDLAFWRWEFRDRGLGRRVSLAVTADGRVVGQYAGVPYPMATAFGDAVFVHIVDSFVHPAFRRGLKRRGLFVETALPWFQACWDAGDAVLYGYPVPVAERIGARALGYKRVRVVDYLCREAGAGSVALPAGVRVEPLPDLDAAVDALFAAFARGKACLTRRDAAYLRWRYVECPERYELLAARRGAGLAGLLVLRPEHELVPSACTIADWIAPPDDEEVTDALLAAATRRAREAGRATLLAVLADTSVEHRAFRRRGFRVVPSAATLERRLTHRIYHPRMTTAWLREHWWYTLGDSDLV